MHFNRRPQRALFVSTRIRGTDGVSLEIEKWTQILESLGVECRFLCGLSDRPPEKTFLVELANFKHPTIEEINSRCIGQTNRTREMTSLILSTAATIKNEIYAAIDDWMPDVVIAENALTLPINIPLGIALDQVLIETRIPCVAHHHDFGWERERYTVNAVGDFILAHFPPQRTDIVHVVINRQAREVLSRRTGLTSWVIPNVMDFSHGDELSPGKAELFRQSLGIEKDETLLLQPTRVVARKGIEHSVELARALSERKCKLVVSHATDDEGLQYFHHLKRFAEYMGVELLFAGDLVGNERNHGANKQFTIGDAYNAADLVTFPSTYEGFGNAFLEAVFYRRLIFCNRYTIFRHEIEPLGFRVPMMDGFVDDTVIDDVRSYLDDGDRYSRATEHNFKLARRHFSFKRVHHQIRRLMSRYDD